MLDAYGRPRWRSGFRCRRGSQPRRLTLWPRSPWGMRPIKGQLERQLRQYCRVQTRRQGHLGGQALRRQPPKLQALACPAVRRTQRPSRHSCRGRQPGPGAEQPWVARGAGWRTQRPPSGRPWRHQGLGNLAARAPATTRRRPRIRRRAGRRAGVRAEQRRAVRAAGRRAHRRPSGKTLCACRARCCHALVLSWMRATVLVHGPKGNNITSKRFCT